MLRAVDYRRCFSICFSAPSQHRFWGRVEGHSFLLLQWFCLGRKACFYDFLMEDKAAELHLPSAHTHCSCRQCRYSQQEKVTAKCRLISFFILSTRWCKWRCQVQENKETSLFLCVARESTASRNTVGMDFEDILVGDKIISILWYVSRKLSPYISSFQMTLLLQYICSRLSEALDSSTKILQKWLILASTRW